MTGGGAISPEPGGQFELSGAQLETVHQTSSELMAHLAQVREVAAPLHIGFLGIGMTPSWSRADMPKMPKGRYKIMTAYMPKVGKLGLDMMYRTCTVQTNLDFSSEADMVKKLRVSIALQPIATALFAYSPFTEGKPNGFLSYRAEIWRDTDNARTGMLPWVFEPGMGYERWVDYALDVPMYFVKHGDDYVDVSGQSFRDLMIGKLPGMPGAHATISDWANHISTIFPEVRLKRYLEMRGADSGPTRNLLALPALWVGILYDDTSLDAAWDLVKNWTAAERQKLRDEVPKAGLAATIHGRTAGEIAGEISPWRAMGSRAGSISTATAGTRRAISRSWKIASNAERHPHRSCWKSSMGLGPDRSIRSTPSRHIDGDPQTPVLDLIRRRKPARCRATLFDAVDRLGLRERLVAGRGIAFRIGLAGPLERSVAVRHRHMLGALHRARRRLVMQLGADRLSRTRLAGPARPGCRLQARDLALDL